MLKHPFYSLAAAALVGGVFGGSIVSALNSPNSAAHISQVTSYKFTTFELLQEQFRIFNSDPVALSGKQIVFAASLISCKGARESIEASTRIFLGAPVNPALLSVFPEAYVNAASARTHAQDELRKCDQWAAENSKFGHPVVLIYATLRHAPEKVKHHIVEVERLEFQESAAKSVIVTATHDALDYMPFGKLLRYIPTKWPFGT
jgi:hypothetical protein